MPKLSDDRLPRYCRHRQSGQAVVYLDGREVLLGKHNTAASREKYNALIAEWLANGRHLPATAEETTILHVIDRFWTHAQAYYRHADGTPTGESDNFASALKPLKKLYGRSPATEFGPLKLKAVREQMIRPKDKGGLGWSRTFANRQTARLRHVFKWATEEEMIPPQVHQGLCAVAALKRGRTEARETKPVTTIPDAYVEAVVPFLPRQVGALVELQAITGARGGELFALRGCDINTGKPTWTYRPVSHKTAHHGHERIIHFGKRAQEILKSFLKPNPQDYLFSPIDAENERREAASKARKTPLSCGNRPGTNRVSRRKLAQQPIYNKDSYARAVTRGCDLADRWEHGGQVVSDDVRLIPRFHPHQLRHNAATNFRRDYGLEAVQALLGQKTMRMAEVYAERNMSLAERVMAEVG